MRHLLNFDRHLSPISFSTLITSFSFVELTPTLPWSGEIAKQIVRRIGFPEEAEQQLGERDQRNQGQRQLYHPIRKGKRDPERGKAAAVHEGHGLPCPS